jgi:hypothetical protein
LPVTISQLAVPKDFAATAASLVLAFRAIGGAIGTAGAQSAYRNKLATKLPDYVTKAALSAGLPESSVARVIQGVTASNMTLVESLPGVNSTIFAAVQQAYKDAQADSFKYGWAVILPFVRSKILFLLSFGLRLFFVLKTSSSFRLWSRGPGSHS